MDVLKILVDLRLERDRLDEAIMTLERLAQGRGRRRGRPPSWMKAIGQAEKAVPKGNGAGKRSVKSE